MSRDPVAAKPTRRIERGIGSSSSSLTRFLITVFSKSSLQRRRSNSGVRILLPVCGSFGCSSTARASALSTPMPTACKLQLGQTSGIICRTTSWHTMQKYVGRSSSFQGSASVERRPMGMTGSSSNSSACSSIYVSRASHSALDSSVVRAAGSGAVACSE